MSSTDWLFHCITTLLGGLTHRTLGSKPAQLYVRLSILSLSHQVTYVSSWIITHYVSAFNCLHFALPDTRVLTHTHTHTHTYIYIYIEREREGERNTYIHIVFDSLYDSPEFCLVWFLLSTGISTFVGYLMPNPSF